MQCTVQSQWRANRRCCPGARKNCPLHGKPEGIQDIKDLREVNNQAYVFLLINGMQQQQKRIEQLQTTTQRGACRNSIRQASNK